MGGPLAPKGCAAMSGPISADGANTVDAEDAGSSPGPIDASAGDQAAPNERTPDAGLDNGDAASPEDTADQAAGGGSEQPNPADEQDGG
jgi:hypothetical protein